MNKTAAQFTEAVSEYKAIAIYIPGSPDPDALASAHAIKLILKHLSIESDIFAEKRVSLPQNQAFIDRLKIPVLFGKEVNTGKYGAYIVPDFQNNRVKDVSDRIPCAVHIDHHAKSRDSVEADFSLIRTDVGSTSTLVTLIVKNLDIVFSDLEYTSMATALTFGIQTDTDKYNNMTPLDIEALSYLSAFADRGILDDINSIPVSPETLLYYEKAKGNESIYRDWGLYGIGYVDSKNRDSIAITADMLLKSSEYNAVAVFAVIVNHKKGEMYLDVSLRTNDSSVDLNRVIKQITPDGGGRNFKGAYQVKLNYFLNAPDRDKLWEVVEATTIETLRRSRDTLYISGIENVYSNIKNRVRSILKKGIDAN
jgi:nanoRNase/pAp phosphatase (c-di-AMP/oligoRNAs hydrolase)